MKRNTVIAFSFLFAVGFLGAQFSAAQTSAADAAKAEKEKAMKNPYPNDLGPSTIEDVSSYTPEQQQGYKLLQAKCSVCHTPSRPLNSQFLDLKPEEIVAAKTSNPEIFKDKQIWQVEDGIWQRYIKRMMAKPGCNIPTEDGKKIFKFITAYSKKVKTGANTSKWAAHRKDLLAQFKEKYPARYKELFETK